jgi:hypothetical protein
MSFRSSRTPAAAIEPTRKPPFQQQEKKFYFVLIIAND